MIAKIPLMKAMHLHWYVQVNNRESGPYTFLEVLSMMHSQDITQSDFVTYRGLGDWHAVNTFENFQPAQVKATLDESEFDPDENEDIPFRKSIRIPLSSEVMVIVDDLFFRGEALDLSTGGCLIRVPKGKLLADSQFKVHFYENSEIQLLPFNAGGNAVRVVAESKVENQRSSSDLVGMQFTSLKKDEKENLRDRLRQIVLATETNEEIGAFIKRNSVAGM